MIITIESTNAIVHVNGIEHRLWRGKTERGVEVTALISRLAVAMDQDQSQFEAELQERPAPKAEDGGVEAIPLRLLL
jgi:hypothetical protein